MSQIQLSVSSCKLHTPCTTICDLLESVWQWLYIWAFFLQEWKDYVAHQLICVECKGEIHGSTHWRETSSVHRELLSSAAISPKNEPAIGPPSWAFWIKSHILTNKMEYAAVSAEQIRVRPLDYSLQKKISIVNKAEGTTIITKSIKFTGNLCIMYSWTKVEMKHKKSKELF